MQVSKKVPQKLLWIDLEMTGLDPAHDRIVEVAAIVTDWDFNELAVFETGVKHTPQTLKDRFAASPFWSDRPSEAKELLQLSAQSPSEKEVEAELLNIVNAHFKADEPVVLAGNSIHADRGFIRQWWPELEARLHYRMLDVTAWKVVMLGKYGVEFPKKEVHRALDDIRESIDELKSYLERLDSTVKRS